MFSWVAHVVVYIVVFSNVHYYFTMKIMVFSLCGGVIHCA